MGTRTSGSVGGQRKRSGPKDRHRASGLPNHLVALATDALDEIRREVWNEARRQGQTQLAKELKGTRFALSGSPTIGIVRRLGLEQPLFVRLGRFPGAEPPEPLSGQAVHKLVRACALAAGVPERLAHPHPLRTYWATSLLEDGVPIHRVPTASDTPTSGPPAATPPNTPTKSTTSPTFSTVATKRRGEHAADPREPHTLPGAGALDDGPHAQSSALGNRPPLTRVREVTGLDT